MTVLSLKSKDTKVITQVQKNLASMFTLISMNPHSARYLLLRFVGGKQQLFIGSDNKNRFGRILRLSMLSCNPNDIEYTVCAKVAAHMPSDKKMVLLLCLCTCTGTFISVKEQISFAVE
ncbi:Hypothetical protein PHPALM_8711 [Phytophthora palmivora]|uniref:Uncharacterized protein n=1 Tax=Phytophthora palmivora TaxID=4796 RepID=A0A2P4Y964_9STRA|nr:Hypothetical protein PHPALM_8711 [Phytophthora palmivora]